MSSPHTRTGLDSELSLDLWKLAHQATAGNKTRTQCNPQSANKRSMGETHHENTSCTDFWFGQPIDLNNAVLSVTVRPEEVSISGLFVYWVQVFTVPGFYGFREVLQAELCAKQGILGRNSELQYAQNMLVSWVFGMRFHLQNKVTYMGWVPAWHAYEKAFGQLKCLQCKVLERIPSEKSSNIHKTFFGGHSKLKGLQYEVLRKNSRLSRLRERNCTDSHGIPSQKRKKEGWQQTGASQTKKRRLSAKRDTATGSAWP